MIHQLDINGNDKVDKAIMRLQAYEPKEGYYLCFSGGKDSCVIKALADMAGVKYDAHYNVTGIDPPELVQFIKTEHADVEFEKPYDKDGNRMAFQKLIDTRKELGLEVPTKWETPEKLMQWWMQDEAEIPDTMITQELI